MQAMGPDASAVSIGHEGKTPGELCSSLHFGRQKKLDSDVSGGRSSREDALSSSK